MRIRSLTRRFRFLVVAGAIMFFVAIGSHSLHADGAVCSACSCDTSYISPVYHHSVCTEGTFWPHYCLQTDGHHCSNYPAEGDSLLDQLRSNVSGPECLGRADDPDLRAGPIDRMGGAS